MSPTPHVRLHPRHTQERSEALAQSAARRRSRTRARDSSARCPRGSEAPTLRDMQHAIAREFGLPGWTALKSL